ncbi:helix-turn-helix domain-containing protein [Kitasatospora sp. A2-31]|uniref:winged helix-turn-helix transcriptional regulator n=1 Tax=Kitasatospora sp. A2-31 TaxID=2916414 RepID=UPI001EEC33FD|nr:winged helix-turn-helix transcriptional regulator [Kitasatospora sp. A2-31]MCG6497067.1 winged helix-turn-helix transcriptional regulator [Kitasatospora sp. A2-31]
MSTATAVLPATSKPSTSTVQRSAEVLSIRWATRIVHALRQGTTTSGDLLAADPFIPTSSAYSALRALAGADIITRTPSNSAAAWFDLSLSPKGQALAPVYASALAWAERYPRQGVEAEEAPEMIEEALGLLASSHTVPLLSELAGSAPMPYPNLVPSLSARDKAAAYQRLLALEERGLVARSGTRRTYRWSATEAGLAIGRVYGALAAWTSGSHTPSAPAKPGTALAAAGRAAVVVQSPAQGDLFSELQNAERPVSTRAAAADLRSITLHISFSHAPAPQPPAPLLVAASAHRR